MKALVTSALWLMGALLIIFGFFYPATFRFKVMDYNIFILISVVLLGIAAVIFIALREKIRSDVEYLLSRIRLGRNRR